MISRRTAAPVKRRLSLLLLAAPLLPASIPPPPEDPADIRTTEERIGAFQLELEEYRDSAGGSTPRQWKKVRMVWRSGDGLSEIRVEDNGYTVRRSYTLRSADRMNVCLSGGGLSQYGGRRDPGAYLRDYVDFLKTCSTAPARRAAYEAELKRTMVDVTAAGDRMRALAVAAFGGLAPRCIRFRQVRHFEMRSECIRYSKAEKPS